MTRKEIKKQARERELRQIDLDLKQIEEYAESISDNKNADMVISLQSENIKERVQEIRYLL